MHRSLTTFLTFAALSAAVPAAFADHCTTWTTAEPELTAPGYYVDFDQCGPNCYSLWVYEESNGIAGLQRSDETIDTTCHGMVEADTIIL